MNPELKKRLKEPTTYIGLALILGGLGVNVSPEVLAEIVSGVMAVCGVVGVWYKESKSRDN
jgi:hypothetical protein